MSTPRKTDSRVLRTKAAIRGAYLSLLGQKNADMITVTDVASAADVDRKTVYNYYDGSGAILDELENELVSSVSTMFRGSDFVRFARDPFGLLDAVTRAFDSHPDLSDPLVRNNKNSNVLSKLAEKFSAQLTPALKAQLQPQMQKYARLYADFLSNGICSVYRDWILGGMQQSLEEIAGQLRVMTDSFINTIERKVVS